MARYMATHLAVSETLVMGDDMSWKVKTSRNCVKRTASKEVRQKENREKRLSPVWWRELMESIDHLEDQDRATLKRADDHTLLLRLSLDKTQLRQCFLR